MPKTKFQEVIFTIMMVFVMVYAMICYNIALNIGGMSNEVFLSAFHELVIMGPIAFVLDFFFVGTIAKKKALKIVNPEKENPFHRERVCQDDFCKFSKFKYLSAEKTPNISCRHIS